MEIPEMKIELPVPDVNDADRAQAKAMFDGRPTSLLMTREAQDTFLLKITAEMFCRERKVLGLLSRIASLERELAETKWIRLDEQLPEDGVKVMAWSKGTYATAYREWLKILIDKSEVYWQPLPIAPPSAQEKETV